VILGRALPPAAIWMMLRNGGGAMPAFRPTEIDDGSLDALATWISTSKPSAADTGK